jgi:hypothetical protein
MAWIAVGVLLLAAAVVIVYLSYTGSTRRSNPSNPSVIVEMDDLPPAEIDFDAGIRANQKFRKARDSKGDVTLE